LPAHLLSPLLATGQCSFARLPLAVRPPGRWPLSGSRGTAQRHRYTFADKAGVLDFVQAAVDRAQEMKSVCFDDSSGCAG
jgi:hypothetical protein